MEAAIIWIALIIIFAVVEIITVGLTSIWFAGGALVALLVDAAGLGPVWQLSGSHRPQIPFLISFFSLLSISLSYHVV